MFVIICLPSNHQNFKVAISIDLQARQPLTPISNSNVTCAETARSVLKELS